jgi:hypothetical protein
MDRIVAEWKEEGKKELQNVKRSVPIQQYNACSRWRTIKRKCERTHVSRSCPFDELPFLFISVKRTPGASGAAMIFRPEAAKDCAIDLHIDSTAHLEVLYAPSLWLVLCPSPELHGCD